MRFFFDRCMHYKMAHVIQAYEGKNGHVIVHHNDDGRFHEKTVDVEWIKALAADSSPLPWVILSGHGNILKSASTRWRLAQRRAFNEMTARRSFDHSMGKFEPQVVDKPIAILTAWRGIVLDPSGQPYPTGKRRCRNDAANELLKANIRRRGLSFYPVVGAGQEQDAQGNWTVNRENSLIVQPVGQIGDDDFRNHIRELLFNPTNELGNGPFPHTQDAAMVKLPSQQQAFLIKYPDGQSPIGPQSYTVERPIGDSAARRTPLDDYFTQMKYGPRAGLGMMDQHDQPNDVGNPPPGTGKPGAGLPGQRFSIKDKKP
jgi:PIN like domain